MLEKTGKKDSLLRIDHLTVHCAAAQALFGIDSTVRRFSMGKLDKKAAYF
jgi:hypothetical protein